MCLGKAYLEGEGKRELVLESVALVEVRGKKLRLSSLFGEEKEIEASLREIDFQSSRIILERAG
ncbi:MAG: CooT family nickel-binding protein [Chloroflexi bacterium]|nr:CooT family nickel-binding protein [Chloroflexota bacterium]